MEYYKTFMGQQQIEQDLRQFTGTENYYNSLGLLFTDGVKFLADSCQAYWLIDLIASYRNKRKEFELWQISVKNNKAVVTMREDCGLNPIVRQEIHHTDFPFQNFKLYLRNNVLMLPSEY